MARITGIGGVFFKSTGDHKKLSEWYATAPRIGKRCHDDFGRAVFTSRRRDGS